MRDGIPIWSARFVTRTPTARRQFSVSQGRALKPPRSNPQSKLPYSSPQNKTENKSVCGLKFGSEFYLEIGLLKFESRISPVNYPTRPKSISLECCDSSPLSVRRFIAGSSRESPPTAAKATPPQSGDKSPHSKVCFLRSGTGPTDRTDALLESSSYAHGASAGQSGAGRIPALPGYHPITSVTMREGFVTFESRCSSPWKG